MQTIDKFNFAGKKAFVRVDFNVPLDENFNITDDTRMRAALPTLKKILADGGSIIIGSHLGRPKGVADKFSLKHIIKHLSCAVIRKDADSLFFIRKQKQHVPRFDLKHIPYLFWNYNLSLRPYLDGSHKFTFRRFKLCHGNSSLLSDTGKQAFGKCRRCILPSIFSSVWPA